MTKSFPSGMGQFIGFSDEHSSLVANVRHLTIHFISPQFHLVFDDLFETVMGSEFQVMQLNRFTMSCFN
jgi:hypothetical protein